jgi:hypothetical protein
MMFERSFRSMMNDFVVPVGMLFKGSGMAFNIVGQAVEIWPEYALDP